MANFRNDEKLRKTERLRTRPEFKFVERKGVRRTSKHFIVFLNANDLDWARLGITVSRKVGSSPIRSWWKRRIRSVFRTHKEQLPVGFDFVVIVRPRSSRPSYERLTNELMDLMRSETTE